MYQYRWIFAFFQHITVEPSYFAYLTVFELLNTFNMNLYLQKACRFNLTTEPDLNTRCDDEKKGVLFVSEVNSKFTSIIVLSGIVISIIALCWSDEAGRRRRPLIYIPILGQIILTLSGSLHSYFWQWSPISAVLCSTVAESISGGIALVLFSNAVYICDICDAESRTMRMGFLGTVKILSLTVGRGASGYMLRTFGFFYSYLICFVISTLGLFLGFILIKDTSVPVEKKVGFCKMLNLKHMMVNSFQTAFNKSLGRKRIIVLLLMVANLLIIFTLIGEISVYYPYLRYRFGWDERTFSNFVFFKFTGSSVGIIFTSVVLSKWLKIHDGLIGILSGIFDLLAIVILLLASQIWQLYFIPLMYLFHGTAMSIGSSFMSKYYDADDLGRLNAVNAAFSLLLPLSYPAYNTIFQKTIDSFPSAFCLLSVVLDVGVVLCFCFAYYFSRKWDTEKPEIQDSPEKNQIQN